MEVMYKKYVYIERRLKSIKLSKAWLFYLSSFSFLIRCKRLSDYCLPQPPTSTLIPMVLSIILFLIYLYHPIHLYHFDTPHDSIRILVEIYIHLIRSSPSLHTHQAWGLLINLSEGLCHSSQCFDVYSWQSWRLH